MFNPVKTGLPPSDEKHAVYEQSEEVYDPSDASPVIPETYDLAQIARSNQQLTDTVNRCVHELISEQGIASPGNLAVHAWDGDLTYGELLRMSSGLAVYLQEAGVGPDVFVALYFGRSCWALVAILAVLRAGGALVLLDPALPIGRMQHICDQAEVRIVLASTLMADLASQLGAPSISVTRELCTSLSSPGPVTMDTNPVAPGHAAYLIFTSGSTGNPKGAVVEHRSLSTTATALVKRLSLGPMTRVLHFSSLSFDACIFELIVTLVAGGCVCVPQEEERMSKLAAVIKKMQVNCLMITPSVSRLLSPSDLPRDATLVLAGEAMTNDDMCTWRDHVRLFNGYGLAECTVISTLRRILPGQSDPANLGLALPSCLTWVAHPDDPSKLVPPGNVGELLIEGPGVGRGYLNQAKATEKAFIKAPRWRDQFPAPPGPQRLYRTGDMVEYLLDGSMRYLGRHDNQTKLRGQRLELGEVESRFKPFFENAAEVLAGVITPSAGQTQMLVVFASFPAGPKQGPNSMEPILMPSTSQFQLQVHQAVRELSRFLPAHMVPTAFFPLHRIPLNPSGKACRKQLHQVAEQLSPGELDAYRVLSRPAKRSPATETEKQLQAIWADILGLAVEHVGADDQFFMLGGDSLAAMQVVTRAQRDYQLAVPLSSVFTGATLSQLAGASQRQNIGDSGDENAKDAFQQDNSSLLRDIVDLDLGDAKSLFDGNVEMLLPTTDFQREWLLLQHKHHLHCYIPHTLEVSRLENACQRLADRHGTLRSLFLARGDEFTQIVLRKMKVSLTRHTVANQSLEEFGATFCSQDGKRPLPLPEPYFQVTLASSSPTQHLFIIRVSHAQFDTTTLEIILEELGAIYRGEQLPPPASDLCRYRQRHALQATPASQKFWSEYLSGATMPTGDQLAMQPMSNLTSRRLRISSREFPVPGAPPWITLATVVKAAWAMVLMSVSQSTDVVFGHTIDGRTLLGLDRAVGCCVNTVPIRIGLQPHWTAQDILGHVQAQYARTIGHQWVEPRQSLSCCRSWPEQTDFGSTVHVERLGARILRLEGVALKANDYFIPFREDILQTMDLPVMLLAEARGSMIGAMLSSNIMPQDQLAFLNDRFGDALSRLGQDVSGPLDISGLCR
jgi:amino acid adenylation domain-containing protein